MRSAIRRRPMVAIDARAPLYDGGICTRVDCVSLGIVVNRDAPALLRRRRRLLAQALRDLGPAGGAAAAADRVFDDRRQGHRPLHAAGVPRARKPRRWPNSRKSSASTRRRSSARSANTTRPAAPEPSTTPCSTTAPPRASRRPRRTGRARSTAAILRLPAAPGITFTYLGVKVNEQAAVHFAGQPSPNLFAAGEIMAGNILGKGYTAGVGMTIGTVFGRIAGTRRPPRAKDDACRCLTRSTAAKRQRAGATPSRPSRAQLQICNACRYCEGFCAVFPAMTRRLEFGKPTSTTSPTCATTAAPACTPASTRRRTNSRSTCREPWPSARPNLLATTPGRRRSDASTNTMA